MADNDFPPALSSQSTQSSDIVPGGFVGQPPAANVDLPELTVTAPGSANEVDWVDGAGNVWQAIRGYNTKFAAPGSQAAFLELAALSQVGIVKIIATLYDKAGTTALLQQSLMTYNVNLASTARISSDFNFKAVYANPTPGSVTLTTPGASGQMCGFGVGNTFHTLNGNFAVVVTGDIKSSTAAGVSPAIRIGTGTPPSAGTTPVVGTLIGARPLVTIGSSSTAGFSFALTGNAFNINTDGTLYWFDLDVQSTAGNPTLENVSFLIL